MALCATESPLASRPRGGDDLWRRIARVRSIRRSSRFGRDGVCASGVDLAGERRCPLGPSRQAATWAALRPSTALQPVGCSLPVPTGLPVRSCRSPAIPAPGAVFWRS